MEQKDDLQTWCFLALFPSFSVSVNQCLAKHWFCYNCCVQGDLLFRLDERGCRYRVMISQLLWQCSTVTWELYAAVLATRVQLRSFHCPFAVLLHRKGTSWQIIMLCLLYKLHWIVAATFHWYNCRQCWQHSLPPYSLVRVWAMFEGYNHSWECATVTVHKHCRIPH